MELLRTLILFVVLLPLNLFLFAAAIWKGWDIVFHDAKTLEDIALFFFYAMSSKWVWGVIMKITEESMEETKEKNTGA